MIKYYKIFKSPCFYRLKYLDLSLFLGIGFHEIFYFGDLTELRKDHRCGFKK